MAEADKEIEQGNNDLAVHGEAETYYCRLNNGSLPCTIRSWSFEGQLLLFPILGTTYPKG